MVPGDVGRHRGQYVGLGSVKGPGDFRRRHLRGCGTPESGTKKSLGLGTEKGN